ncbi:DUF932 domain-containing protein [Actinoplanes sp. NPDC020271]|uniref:DUF932 domain-containing protein n=1 Tax=Actinoplanes sp. NPDC020271 TaxID=3363896 RepID=UPI0037B0B0EC
MARPGPGARPGREHLGLRPEIFSSRDALALRPAGRPMCRASQHALAPSGSHRLRTGRARTRQPHARRAARSSRGMFSMAQPTLTIAPNRHISLESMMRTLSAQKARADDIIASPAKLRSVDGKLVIAGAVPQLRSDGVTLTDGIYALNDIALGGIGDKLKIPVAYLRRMARENVPLLDYNINGWLENDDRRFLVRCLREDPASSTGVARAFLSDRYLRIDNLDVLLSVLDGIRETGVHVEVASGDLTDRRMYVRFICPQLQVLAPQLLRDYRSPFDGRRGSDLPIICAGFRLTNSETGFGRYRLDPFVRMEVCLNGMTIDRGVLSRVHLGSRITDDDGIIEPSAATIAAELEVIKQQTKDAVKAYLDIDFVTRAVRELEKAAGVSVTRPEETLKVLGQKLKYSEDQQRDILAHFISGADLSAGGIMQAVTSYGRSVDDADVGYQMENTAIQAMRLAAAAA